MNTNGIFSVLNSRSLVPADVGRGDVCFKMKTVTKQQLKMLWRTREQEKRKECLGFTA